MKQSTCGIPPHLWAEYSLLQEKANRTKLDPYAWALEEQLNHFLDAVPNRLPGDAQARAKCLSNLVLHRTKKHSRRRRLLEQYQHVRECSPEEIALHRLHLGETTARLRSLASPVEWRILCSLADGNDYLTVANREGMTVTALKSRVCRCRRHLAQIAA